MFISGNEPSSVTRSQTKWFQKLETIARKYKNKLRLKEMV